MHLIVDIAFVSGDIFTVSHGVPLLMFLYTSETGPLNIPTLQMWRPKFCKTRDSYLKEQCQDRQPICLCVPCASAAG